MGNYHVPVYTTILGKYLHEGHVREVSHDSYHLISKQCHYDYNHLICNLVNFWFSRALPDHAVLVHIKHDSEPPRAYKLFWMIGTCRRTRGASLR